MAGKKKQSRSSSRALERNTRQRTTVQTDIQLRHNILIPSQGVKYYSQFGHQFYSLIPDLTSPFSLPVIFFPKNNLLIKQNQTNFVISEVQALEDRALQFYEEKDYRNSIEYHLRALEINLYLATLYRDPTPIAWSYHYLSLAHLRLGNYSTACYWQQVSLAIIDRAGLKRDHIIKEKGLNNMCDTWSYLAGGYHDKADQLIGNREGNRRETSNSRVLALSCYREALSCYQKVLVTKVSLYNRDPKLHRQMLINSLNCILEILETCQKSNHNTISGQGDFELLEKTLAQIERLKGLQAEPLIEEIRAYIVSKTPLQDSLKRPSTILSILHNPEVPSLSGVERLVRAK